MKPWMTGCRLLVLLTAQVTAFGVAVLAGAWIVAWLLILVLAGSLVALVGTSNAEERR